MAWWRVSGGKGPAKGTLESLSLSLGSAACAECRRLGCCTDCKGGQRPAWSERQSWDGHRGGTRLLSPLSPAGCGARPALGTSQLLLFRLVPNPSSAPGLPCSDESHIHLPSHTASRRVSASLPTKRINSMSASGTSQCTLHNT